MASGIAMEISGLLEHESMSYNYLVNHTPSVAYFMAQLKSVVG